MKRILVLTLLVALVPAAALFASPGQEAAAPSAKMQLSWCMYVDGTFDENSYAEQYMKQKYPDVEIKKIGLIRGDFYNQLNTRLAGGEKIDMIHEWGNSYISTHVQQGVLMELPISELKKYTPKFFQVQKDFGREVFLATTVEGKNYGVPNVNESQTFPFTDGIRVDWLKKVGVSYPLPDILTLDQLENIFKLFTQNDPDGNGKADTYGFSMRAKDSAEWMFCNLLGAFNVAPGTWNKLPDGTVTYGVLMDNFRDLLRQVNKWYKAGYMDPEFVTQDWAGLRERWNNGKIGYIFMSTWYRLIPTGENWEQPLAINPKAEIGMVPPVKGPTGSYGYFGWGKPTGGLVFGKHMEKEPAKLHRNLQIIDELTTSSEAYIALNWGILGTHWTKNAKTAAYEYLVPYNEPAKRGPIGCWFWGKFSSWATQAQSWGLGVKEWTKYATNRTFAPETSYTHLVTISADANKLVAAAQPIWRSWIVKFITGEKSLDTDWEQYKKEVLDAGMAKVIPEANTSWKNLANTLDKIEAQLK